MEKTGSKYILVMNISYETAYRSMVTYNRGVLETMGSEKGLPEPSEV